MPEPGTRRRTWELFRCSVRLLAHERKLLLLPAASFTCALLVLFFFSVLFLAPALLDTGQSSWPDARQWAQVGHRWVNLVSFTDPNRVHPHLNDAAYARFMAVDLNRTIWAGCLAMTIMLPLLGGLLNAAFYNEIIRAFAGEPISLRNGLRTACRRFRVLFNWFLFSALVVGVLRLVVGRFGMAGRIAASLLGMSWAAASFFVIPVLLREKRSGEDTPLKALGTSATLLKRTWGESVTGFVGFQILRLPGLVGAVLIYLCFRMSGGSTPTLVGLATGLAILLVFSSVIIGAAENIYRCALYVYATEGVVPEPFTEEQLHAAWRMKTPKRD